MITIKDLQERPIKACCKIPYKGYIISVSTLMGKCASIAVFSCYNKYEKYGFETFEEAIEEIDYMNQDEDVKGCFKPLKTDKNSS